jgi:hypothetical protein
VVDVERHREDLFRDLGGLGEDLMGVPVGIDAQRGVEGRALVVAHVHRGIDRRQEELDPELVDEALVSFGSVFISSAKASPWRTRRCTIP